MKKLNKRTSHLLINEVNKLVEKGYDRTMVENKLYEALIINEFDMSSVNNFMGGLGRGVGNIVSNAGEGLIQTGKRRIARFFIQQLGIVDEKSFMGLVIQNAFANISFSDYNKLTDCQFVTKHVAKALIETMVDVVREQHGLTSLFYDAIKETLAETATNSPLYRGLEKNLIHIVCPIVQIAKKKFGNYFS